MIPIYANYRDKISILHGKDKAQDLSAIYQQLAQIQTDIAVDKDAALIKYTKQFDQIESDNFQIKVTEKEISEAYNFVSKEYISAIKKAKKNLEDYHTQQQPKDWYIEKEQGIEYGASFNPIDSAGLYVPGGRAPYPSSVLMNAVPATIAGVSNIVMATPPQKNGKIAPQVLVAADICNITNIVKAGGSQAVFALAQGTESVDKVDKIVGPGNIYVTIAKQMVYGQVDIDKPAGPSESLIYINDAKYVSFAAAELLAQLEHDPDAVAVAVSESKDTLLLIQKELKVQLENCQRKETISKSIENSMLFLVRNQEEAIDAINRVASEHLVLLVDEYKSMLPKIKHAGAIFLGPYTPVALGDYYGGTNHVLPTSGAARFASPLGVMDFIKYSSLLYYSKEKLAAAKEDVRIISEMEGFDAHFKSIERRL
jgi:histidinol dehydrogenase